MLPSISRTAILTLAALSLHSVLLSQTAGDFPNANTVADRGFAPAGTYAISQIESVSPTTGNVSLSIPIASLPPGRGGSPGFKLSLVYNSAINDFVGNWQQVLAATGSGYTWTLPSQLAVSALGGWHYSSSYQLYELIQNDAPPGTNCTTDSTADHVYLPYFATPDGNAHQLFLEGYAPAAATGAYNVSMMSSKVGFTCTSVTLPSNGVLVYYTADGSTTRIEVNVNTHVWTAHMKDGSKIAGSTVNTHGVQPQIQTITDRNGNQTQITVATTQTGITTTIQDDLQRAIVINATGGADTITAPGHGGATLTTTVNYTAWSAPGIIYTCRGNDVDDTSCTYSPGGGPISSIVLPPASTGDTPLQYQFNYDCPTATAPGTPSCNQTWGELHHFSMPSGASVDYQYFWDHSPNPPASNRPYGGLNNPIISKVVSYSVVNDGSPTAITEATAYNIPALPDAGPDTSTITAPDGGQTSYQFYGFARTSFPGEVVKITKPSGATTDQLWALSVPDGGGPTGPVFGPFVKASIHTPSGGSLSEITEFSYDKNGNPTSKKESDWVPASSVTRSNPGGIAQSYTPPSWLRTTTDTYTVSSSDSQMNNTDPNGFWNTGAPSIPTFVASETVAGVGVGSYATFLYDGNGNQQHELHWDSTKSANPGTLSRTTASVTDRVFDAYGNLIQVTDPNGNVTQYTFDSSSLYATRKVEAFGTSQAETFTYTRDFNTALLDSQTDENSVPTNYTYDLLGRQILEQTAYKLLDSGGNSIERDTSTTYEDNNLRVIVKQSKDTTSNLALVSITDYDPMGRVRLTRQLEDPAGNVDDDTVGIKVQKRFLYSGSNSYELVSNPYRESSSAGATSDSTMGWSLTTHDQDGRVLSVESFNGSGIPKPFGSVTIGNSITCTPGGANSLGISCNSYSSNVTTVTDEVGNVKSQSIDGFGRLSGVAEAPNVSGYNYLTTYSYDALDNLTSVSQSGLARSFSYDSLRRLIAAHNPENSSAQFSAGLTCTGATGSSWTTCYSYDSNGNLSSKTDNRQTSISYTYDAFNRVTAKSYAIPSNVAAAAGVAATPAATYCYGSSCPGVGSPSYAIGRLTSATATNGNSQTVSQTLYTNFDAFGRVLSHSQITAGTTYSFSYTYNLAGDLLTETYPSQRTITTTYDGADRPLTLAGKLNNATTSYVTQALYSPSGQLSNLNRSNGIVLTMSQDNRLRPNCASESNASNGAIWSGCESWNSNSTLNSTQFNHRGPSYSQPLTFIQTYLYDPLNRLTKVTDNLGSSTGTQNYARTFSYDAFGNMWVGSSSGITPQGNTPTADLYTNNQLTGGTYDAAGNQTFVNANNITYDVENRQTNVVGAGVNETYVYDAAGKRVEKTGYNGSPATVFVYDASGRLAAEYSTTPNSATSTWYLTLDYLGTPRMVTDQSGAIISRHDYLPFGEEILANQAGRLAEWGPASDTINQKFTGKERDSESGLDYFGARYYGSALGRFTTTDPEQASASLFEPQSWNLYSYAWNRPLSYKDPDGRNPLLVTAAVGAGVGSLVGGGFELITQLSRNGGSLDDVKWGRVGTAALGGGVTGGIAGLTLGLGTAAGVTLGVGQTVAINAGANVIGGEVQRQADAALGNGPAPSGLDEVAAVGIDAIAGGVGGLTGGRIADQVYPLPNVRKEIELLKFANRRSTRAARIESFKAAADQQAARNAATSGVQGGARTSTYTGWLQIFWNALKPDPKACVSVSDSASGSKFGGCK